MPTEFDLIQALQSHAGKSLPPDVLGIGDDCAVWPLAPHQLLICTDMLIEGRHFSLSEMSYAEVGRKSISVNLSDIAAMAGQPLSAVVSLGLPTNSRLDDIQSLMAALIETASKFDTAIVGGDTTSHDGPLTINVSVMGHTTQSRPVLRSGARSGDAIFVTGPLGGSILGHHWSFTPRLREAQSLHQMVHLNSLIDLSDGLCSDIRHLLTASNVGCQLQADDIPISEAAIELSSARTPLSHALSDGEDYELLLTVGQEDASRLRSCSEIDLFEIGLIVEDPLCVHLIDGDGNSSPLPDDGWKHHFQ